MTCPICLKRERLVRHHINGRDVPGAEEKWNELFICSNDHEKVHSGDIIIEVWAMTSDGMKLFWHKKGEEGTTGMEARPYVR